MMIDCVENTSKKSIPLQPITTTTCPPWKLYRNPLYNLPNPQLQHCQISSHTHPRHFSLSVRNTAASFSDLTFIKPKMETELDFARAQILELKVELERERKARKKGDSMSTRLAKQLAEERRGRQALERACEQFAQEILTDKAEMDRMKKEIQEERKMLRMAQVLREERFQMKLAEANILFEERLLEIKGTKQSKEPDHDSKLKMQHEQEQERERVKKRNRQDHKSSPVIAVACNSSGEFNKQWLSDTEKSCDDNSREHIQRRASPAEAENPHIKRGMKGYVEFPRVVGAMGSRRRYWATKLECHKAQLRILSRQKSPIRSNNLIIR